ncbi:uncharacterized protein LOC125226162 [Leguminivora glycinivorella]|uniref:uncharacterized protein LOC125226162 n=1 Tax=Leguminivora glycinivorella TaxID=1035111 RepID=UPI002010A50B|nr:uncharacterized protein LOC125226162 [Leguminivora glycinivorella]
MTMSKVTKKQLKITKLFRKGYKRPRIFKENDENSELQQEVAELERKLREKQDYLFQIQRASYRHSVVVPKKIEDNDVAITKSIIVQKRIDGWQKTLDLTAMLTGMEVESYGRDHCTVIFHMQLDREVDVKHGVTISKVDGEHKITGCSLPLGFNLKAMLDGCNNEVSLKTFDVIRKALTAYYARLEQYEDLKVFLSVDASLFKLMDGTQMEITFVVRNELEEDSETTESITFILHYTMYDIRPRDYSFKGLSDKPQETLREQFMLFKKYHLTKAFKLAFIDGEGSYKLVRHLDNPLNEPRRKRPLPKANANPAHDDTFHVEDCSESSGDENENC